MNVPFKKKLKVFSLVLNRLGQERERRDKTETQWDGERLRNRWRVLIRRGGGGGGGATEMGRKERKIGRGATVAEVASIPRQH